MAVHLGATRGLGMRTGLPRWISADIQVLHAFPVLAGCFGVTLTISLLTADLMGLILLAL